MHINIYKYSILKALYRMNYLSVHATFLPIYSVLSQVAFVYVGLVKYFHSPGTFDELVILTLITSYL